MQVPLLDLKGQYETIREDILTAVTEVLDSQICIGGPKVKALEEAVAKVSGCQYGIGVSSGTDALLNALMSLDIGPGDEVITTPFTFFATAGSIVRAGAKPVFVDIDPETYNIDPAQIEKAITKRTRAIMPVHLFGQMADMDPIMQAAGSYSLAVIEDAAQAITATYKGKPAGSFGTAGCFSFYPSKNLGGIGDGGMVVTNDEALYKRCLIMRNHGNDIKYFHQYVGGNFRLDPIQAAALLVKLEKLDSWSKARQKNAAHYNKRFKGAAITTPIIRDNCESIYNQYVIRVPKRDAMLEHLRANNIGCVIYYPLCLHLQQCFEYLEYKEGDFPHAEQASKEVLALPIYPELTDEMLDYVADMVLDFLD